MAVRTVGLERVVVICVRWGEMEARVEQVSIPSTLEEHSTMPFQLTKSRRNVEKQTVKACVVVREVFNSTSENTTELTQTNGAPEETCP